MTQRYALVSFLATLSDDDDNPPGRWIGDIPSSTLFNADIIHGEDVEFLRLYLESHVSGFKRAIKDKGWPGEETHASLIDRKEFLEVRLNDATTIEKRGFYQWLIDSTVTAIAKLDKNTA